MAFRYPRRRWRTGPWTLMGTSSGNIKVPDEPNSPFMGDDLPGGLGPHLGGPGRMGYNLGDLENLKKYPDNELWKYGKIPDSATMMPKSSTYGVSQTPQYDYTMDASAGSPAKKKSNKLKYIVEALQELEGPEPPKLAGGKFGRAMPAPLGFSLANMGAYVGDPVARQTAMAKSRMEEELQRRRKLLGGGY